MRKLLDFRFFRFLVVGTLNTAFSYGIYAALLYLGLPYVWANLGSLIAGVASGFIAQGRFVFGNNDSRLFGRYVFCWACIWVVNVLLIKAFIHLGLDAYRAGALALAPIVVISYLVQRLLVFRRDDARPGSPAG